MNKAILTLIVCALAFVPAQAQQVHSHSVQKSEKSKDEVTYSCPMHPDVKAKKKGKCPKCGMDLRPVSQEEKTAEIDSQEPVAMETAKMNIPDIELLDQNGRKIHFYNDLVKGHTVAINFIFTTCTTICPPLGATFARVQKELGDRMGRDVRLISITVDPATDTPERLKRGARNSTRAMVGLLSPVTSHRLTNCYARSALPPRAARIIRRPCSSVTTRPARGRAPTVWPR